jgi:hypothetical protein
VAKSDILRWAATGTIAPVTAIDRLVGMGFLAADAEALVAEALAKAVQGNGRK